MKTIKSFFVSAVAALALLIGFAGNVSACAGGNQCEQEAPYLSWQPANGIEVGGAMKGWGKALSGADGQGDTSQSQAATLTEGTNNFSTKTTLTVDALGADCTACGDNQYQMMLEGTQKAFAGAQNLSTSANGPAFSQSEGLTASGLQGFAWGRTSVPQQ